MRATRQARQRLSIVPKLQLFAADPLKLQSFETNPFAAKVLCGSDSGERDGFSPTSSFTLLGVSLKSCTCLEAGKAIVCVLLFALALALATSLPLSFVFARTVLAGAAPWTFGCFKPASHQGLGYCLAAGRLPRT